MDGTSHEAWDPKLGTALLRDGPAVGRRRDPELACLASFLL